MKKTERAATTLLYALLIITPLAQGAVQAWSVTLIHILTLTAVLLVLMGKSMTWEWRWIKTPLDWPFLALFILCLISLVFSVHTRSSINALILLINYIAVFYLFIHLTRSRTNFKILVYLIIGIAVFLAVFGMFKKTGLNPFPWWDYNELKYSPDFVASTFGNHNHLAGYLEMAISVALGMFLTGFRNVKLFFMVYFAMLLLLAHILTLSRGGWISLLLAITFMFAVLIANPFFKYKRFLFIVGVLFVISSLFILGSTPVVERVMTLAEQDTSANLSGRLQAWKGTAEMIEDHLLTGTGPGTYATVFTRYQPPGINTRFLRAHNDYLHFVAETGVLLIPVIIWMFVALYKKGFTKMKHPSRLVRGITLGALTGITAILVHSISDFNLHIPANALLFTVLAAMVAAPVPVDKSADCADGAGYAGKGK